jgi:hypothetical protein
MRYRQCECEVSDAIELTQENGRVEVFTGIERREQRCATDDETTMDSPEEADSIGGVLGGSGEEERSSRFQAAKSGSKCDVSFRTSTTRTVTDSRPDTRSTLERIDRSTVERLDDQGPTKGSCDLGGSESRQLSPGEASKSSQGQRDDGVEVSSRDTTSDVWNEVKVTSDAVEWDENGGNRSKSGTTRDETHKLRP